LKKIAHQPFSAIISAFSSRLRPHPDRTQQLGFISNFDGFNRPTNHRDMSTFKNSSSQWISIDAGFLIFQICLVPRRYKPIWVTRHGAVRGTRRGTAA
jgi:hypothetical protein